MRAKNWETLLHNHIAEHRHKKFKWKDNNCCTFGNECVRLLTGIDLFEATGHRWKTKADAAARVKAAGAKDWGDLVIVEIEKHFKRIPASLAKRGDIVLVSTPLGKGVAVVYGGGVLALSQKGLEKLPMSSALIAWSIC